MKRLLLLFLMGWGLNAQIFYSTSKTTALSGAAEVVTVQLPATGTNTVNFLGAWVDCTVACTLTVERNGAAATSTTLAVNNINPGQTAAAATGWSSSNVGTGTVISRIGIAAGGGVSIDLTKIRMTGNGTGQNLTIRTNSITGTVNITIVHSES